MTSKRIRVGAQAAVAVGGVAALSWEVLWQIEAALSLGISALGTALTLAATMGGMTLGSLAMGRFLRSRPSLRPLRVYGYLEAAIGAAGLLMIPGFVLVERIDSVAYAALPAAAPLVHILSIVFLLGPPAIAMGATVPTFERMGRTTGTSVALLYGINTAGAALGVLLLSFAIIPALGILWTCLCVSATNLSVFAVTRWLDRETEDCGALTQHFEDAAVALPRRALASGAAVVVFGTGFVTFALEVAWFRSLRAAFQSTTESFAIILASVLIPLAIGARLVPWLRRRGVTPTATLLASGACILLATPLIERMDQLVWMVSGAYSLMLGAWLVLSLAMLGPAVLFLGMALPWYLEEYAEPESSGRLYAINTLGAVAGSLVAAWILLPTLGFARTAWALGVLASVLAFAPARQHARWPGILATAAALGIAVVFTSSLGRDRVQSPHAIEGNRIVAYDEGPDSTIAVLESPNRMRRLLIDGFVATSEHKTRGNYMQWMGRLPMMLHPDPKHALVICFGTGQTANAVRHEGPDLLDVVDVDGTVFEFSSLFLSNEGVLNDERVNAVVMDGRAWLRRTHASYDVITLEPMPPHFAGVNALYSREFYETATKRLAPGGILAQWLPIHLLPPYFAISIARTFGGVFPDSLLWIDPAGGTAILLGRREGGEAPLGEEWPGLAREIERPLSGREIRAAIALTPTEFAHYITGGETITDDSQLLAYGRVRGRLVNYQSLAVKRNNMRIIRRIGSTQRED